MARARKATRNELVAAEARTWLGTPFHEQASVKGKGCDCKGLVWGVARELGFPEADSLHANFIGYHLGRGGSIPSTQLAAGMADLFDRIDGEPLAGDVLLLAPAHAPRTPVHLAICLGGTAIHAQISSKDWVKETAMRVIRKVYSIHSVWRWRKLKTGRLNNG